MLELPYVKILVGPSAHYHELKSGEIRHQKSKPAKPLWRILIIDEELNKVNIRIFPSEPSTEEIYKVVHGVLGEKDLPSCHIVVPKSLEKLCPGLQESLLGRGAKIYTPKHGFASGARDGSAMDDFLMFLGMDLQDIRERMASCAEIAAAAAPLGIVTYRLRRGDDINHLHYVLELARKITKLRGRDPEKGKNLRRHELREAPVNKPGREMPPKNALDMLLEDPANYLAGEHWGKQMWDVICQLDRLRKAGASEQKEVLMLLGGTAIIYEIESRRDSRNSFGFLSSLGFRLSDPRLNYLISEGIQEALKNLVILGNKYLQFSAAKVTVHYPEGCSDISLRSLPAHNHLEKMIQAVSGGQVTVFPDLNGIDWSGNHFLTPVAPHILRIGEVFFNQPWNRGQTPKNPAKCLSALPPGRPQTTEGWLWVVAILPETTSTYIPCGDEVLARRMTVMVNERLGRARKEVACTISPFMTFGDAMNIGYPPA